MRVGRGGSKYLVEVVWAIPSVEGLIFVINHLETVWLQLYQGPEIRWMKPREKVIRIGGKFAALLLGGCLLNR